MLCVNLELLLLYLLHLYLVRVQFLFECRESRAKGEEEKICLLGGTNIKQDINLK